MTASNSWILPPLLLALLAVPAAARADAPATTPTPEQVEAAKALYHEARELHRQGKLKEALERAMDAYRTASTPVTALEAAQLLIEAGQLVEARDLTRAVALFPPSPRESDKGRDARQEAATLAGTLDARIPKIAIAGRPAGLDVMLDGKPFAGSDPTAWQGVDPGPHTLLVRAVDRVCTTISVTLAEGEARTIDLHDVAVSCRAEPAPSSATDASPAPAAPAPPPAPVVELVTSPPSDRRPGPLHWVGVAVGGAGALAIGLGLGVAFAAKSSYDSVESDCPARGCTSAAYGVRETARSHGDAATVTMIAGAAALTGGALLFVFVPDTHANARVGVGPGNVRLVIPFD